MNIFAEGELSEVLRTQTQQMRNEVLSEDKNRLLNLNETDYLAYLVSKYQIDPLVLDWDAISISDAEANVRSDYSPMGRFHAGQPDYYRRQVITYHVPFSGEEDLLRYMPSTRLMWTTEVAVAKNTVSFSIINWQNNAEEIRREADSTINNIREQAGHVNADVSRFNQSLDSEARQFYTERKNELLRQSNLMASLGVPFQKAASVPSTFTVPVSKHQVVVKPSAPTSPYNPEPALDQSVYEEILRIIHETGVEMERHPGIYQGKDEESLRDYFILVLSPHFQSVTGETFNRTGKTDILIRHEKANVFVAECKFWGGIKLFYETIDQTLGYLTWRDSKAAVICFIRNKELQPVLDQIAAETLKHPCFIKSYGNKSESWFRFEFHLKDDNTRNVRLAVLCFHLP